MSDGIKIGSNVASLMAQRRLAQSGSAVSQIYERLSSGQRITRASDDAAGLAISMSLSTSSRVFTQSIRNVNDAVSATSIASGATSQLTDILVRIKELAEQSANGTFNQRQRGVMNKEAQALRDEFNRIIQTTSFNGVKLLREDTGIIRIAAGSTENSGALYLNGTNLGVSQKNDGTFSTTQYTASGNYSIGVGDVNGDGILDTATATSSGVVSILIGNGDGSYRARQSFTVSGTPSISDLAFGDFNSDGYGDLILTPNTPEGTQFVYFANSDGTFSVGPQIASSFTSYTQVRTADLDGDGNVDFVTAGNSGSAVGFFVHLSNGDGTFRASVSNAMTNAIQDFQLADVNNDGILDFVGASNTNQGISVSIGNSDGSFNARRQYRGNSDHSYSVTVGDFNGDGKVDVAELGSVNNTLTMFYGNGDGTFSNGAATVLEPYGAVGYFSVRSGDFNGDGQRDLVLGGPVGNLTKIWYSNGDGTFQAGVTLGTEKGNADAITVADLNNDGALDIAALGTSGISISIGGGVDSSSLAPISVSSRSGAYSTMRYIETAQTALSLAIGQRSVQIKQDFKAHWELSLLREKTI